MWRSPPGTLVLWVALFGHVALAIVRLYQRRSLKMPPWEIAQIALGLLIPFWLTVHILGTFGIHLRFGVDDDYTYLLNLLWPDGAGRQSLMLVIVWLHGCIGVHFWLRLRPWYRALQPVLLALAVLLPTLALIGFVEGGREVEGPGRRGAGLARGRGRRRQLADAGGAGLGLRHRARRALGVRGDPAGDLRPARRAQLCTRATAAGSACAIRTASGSRSRPG